MRVEIAGIAMRAMVLIESFAKEEHLRTLLVRASPPSAQSAQEVDNEDDQ